MYGGVRRFFFWRPLAFLFLFPGAALGSSLPSWSRHLAHLGGVMADGGHVVWGTGVGHVGVGQKPEAGAAFRAFRVGVWSD
jgi:hypothetical protein